MNKIRYSTKQGAVSMITVMLMSIILLVLVIGLVQLMLNEQRQSSDNELTNRAFYAAEAGLESARQYVSGLTDTEIETIASTSLADAECLQSDGELQGDINPFLIADAGYEAQVVCQKISGVGGTYTIGPEIGLNSPRQYNLGTNKDSLSIRWATKGSDSTSFRPDNSLPPNSSWSSPAALRIQLYSFESGVSRDNLLDTTREFYVLPATSGVTTHSFNDIDDPVLAQCDSTVATGQKMCSVEITGITTGVNRTQYISISFLYAASTLELTPLTAGAEDDSLTGQLRVDTTGRVGDIFRRIQANVDIDNPAVDNLPAYTILGNQICKSFEVTDDTADFPTINDAATVLDYCSA